MSIAQNEKERTQYQADRAEERRRGTVALDVKEMSRLPEEYQQKQIDEMNEAIENDHRQSEIPANMTEEAYKRLMQMRADGNKEELIQDEMSRLRREEGTQRQHDIVRCSARGVM